MSQRTDSQNAALHLWFRQVAQALDDNGIEMNTVIEAMRNMSVRPTENAVKEIMWRPVQTVLYGKISTTDCPVEGVGRIYDHLNRLLSNLDPPIHVPFPSREDDERPE